MKKIIFSLVFLFSCIICNAQSDFTNMSEVVQCNLNKNEIYSNIMQNWSTLNGANQKGTNNLDYCDKDAGIINIKTKIYLGFHKCNMGGYGYEGFGNAIITYKIKDNKYKVTLITNTVTFNWTGDHESITHDINLLYPEFIAKKHGNIYIKKSSNDIILNHMPNIMINFFDLCKKLHINTEEDF